MDSKNIIFSKTLWFNLLAPLFAYAASKGITIDPDTQMQIVLGVMSLANIIIRKFTKTAVTVLPVKAS